MKRVWRYSSVVAAILVLAGGGVWGSGWLWSFRDPGVKASAVTLVPERVISPGRAAEAELTLEVPLRRRIVSATAKAGKGSIVSGEVEVRSSWRWSHRVWRVAATLRKLDSGPGETGRLQVELSPAPGFAAPEVLTYEIPPLRIEEAPSSSPLPSEPLLADAESIDVRGGAGKWWWPGAALLALLALSVWRILRRRRSVVAAAPPWERALAALRELRSGVVSGRLSAASGVEVLADVVRSYLEERFAFPASRLTTPEFLIRVADSEELSSVERAFLRDFMTGADLVKFARAPAAGSALEEAVDKAELLVERTIPSEKSAAEKGS